MYLQQPSDRLTPAFSPPGDPPKPRSGFYDSPPPGYYSPGAPPSNPNYYTSPWSSPTPSSYYSPKYSTPVAQTEGKRVSHHRRSSYQYPSYTSPRFSSGSNEVRVYSSSGEYKTAGTAKSIRREYVPNDDYGAAKTHHRPRRASHSTSPKEAYYEKEKRASTSVKASFRKATKEDARHAGIPPGYSYKNWDPTEEPILLLGSVFDVNSLGKWIYDWTVFGPASDVWNEMALFLNLFSQPVRDPKRFPKVVQGLKGAKGFLGQSSVIGLCDTGAGKNFISRRAALNSGLHIHRLYGDDRPSFVQGNGAMVHAVGYISTTWAFEADRDCPPIDIQLYVLKDSIFDVILGAEFLEQTNTMTDHRERLSPMPRPQNALNGGLVNICGTPGRRIRGHLDSEECFAVYDSGAEPNLLSYDLVKRRNWLGDLVVDPDSGRLLQFADGSTAKTEGRLRLKWKFGLGAGEADTWVDFDVLRGCSHDVILGSDFLDATESFTKHKHSFQEVVQEGPNGLNPVVWIWSKLERKRKKTKIVPQPTDQERLREAQENELERKAQAEYQASRQRRSSSSRSRSPTASLSSGGTSSGPPINNAAQTVPTQPSPSSINNTVQVLTTQASTAPSVPPIVTGAPVTSNQTSSGVVQGSPSRP